MYNEEKKEDVILQGVRCLVVTDLGKGSWFARPDLDGMGDVFVPYTEIEVEQKGFKTLLVGDHIIVDIAKTAKGLRAKNVKIIRGNK